MGVLKPIKDNGTVHINVKAPVELRDRANKIKEALKAKGFTIDINEAAVDGIKRLVKRAEKELKELAGVEAKKPAPAPARPPVKQSPRPAQKSA